jgi:hypothetical protein
MSESRQRPGQPGEDALQEAFDRLAGSLDLRLEPAAGCREETRSIGIAAAVIHQMVTAEPEENALSPGKRDDEQIEALLTGYEELTPAKFVESWRDYATDPHAGVGPSWVGRCDQEALDYWLGKKELAEALEYYPPYFPDRKIRILDLRIVYIGDTRAVATYHLEEDHPNGRITAGNVALILIKTRQAGWRIIVATKGGRTELPAKEA